MAAFLIAILVLLFAACVLFLAAGWRPRASHIVTRDSLNKDFITNGWSN